MRRIEGGLNPTGSITGEEGGLNPTGSITGEEGGLNPTGSITGEEIELISRLLISDSNISCSSERAHIIRILTAWSEAEVDFQDHEIPLELAQLGMLACELKGKDLSNARTMATGAAYAINRSFSTDEKLLKNVGNKKDEINVQVLTGGFVDLVLNFEKFLDLQLELEVAYNVTLRHHFGKGKFKTLKTALQEYENNGFDLVKTTRGWLAKATSLVEDFSKS